MEILFRHVSLVLASILAFLSTYAQDPESGRTIVPEMPASPNAASLGTVSEVPVDLYTGRPQIDVPIWSVTSGPLSLPISLSYNSDLKLQNEASLVGLGWSLNAGGLVSRTVNGLPDDASAGWYYQSANVPSTIDESNTSDRSYLRSVSNGSIDAHPDEFFYSIAGSSGNFVIGNDQNFHFLSHQAVKVEQNGFDQFIITDPYGNIYIFGEFNGTIAREQSTYENSCSGAPESYTSSWMLIKVVSADGTHTIDLEYSPYYQQYATSTTRTEYAQGQISPCPNLLPTTCTSFATVNGWALSKITTNTQEVIFNLSSDRQDVNGANNGVRLDGITVKDDNGDVVKEFALDYDYFTWQTNATYLRLVKLRTIGQAGNELPPYEFEYDGSELPGAQSNSIDHWGYYNGKSNASLVPTTVVNTGQVLGAANRETDHNYTSKGVLTKMVHPTGGYTAFEWEGHDYSRYQNSFVNEPETTPKSENISLTYSNGPQTETKNFTLDTQQWVKVTYGNTAGNSEDPPTVFSQTTGVFCQGGCSTVTEYVNMSAGNHSLEVFVENPGDNAFITVEFVEQTGNTIIKKDIGGVRIKSISTVESLGANPIKKTFTYDLPGHPGRSSGVASAQPNYEYTYKHAVVNPNSVPGVGGSPLPGVEAICGIQAINSSSLNHIGAKDHVGYTHVRITFGDEINNVGWKDNRFTGHNTFADRVTNVKGAPVLGRVHLRGLLLEQATYDNQGNLKVKQTNTYGFNTQAMLDDPTQSKANTHVVNTWAVAYDLNAPQDANDDFIFTDYSYVTEWVTLDSTSETAYDDNNNAMVSSTNHYYDNATHTFKTRSETLDSEGVMYIQESRYPDDYAGTATDEAGLALVEMRDNLHMIAYPIEVLSWKQENGGAKQLLAGGAMTYRDFDAGSGIKIYPWKSYQLETGVPITASNFTLGNMNSGTLNFDSRFRVLTEAQGYDPYGNLTQYQLTDDIPNALIYGYNKQFPIAQIMNSTASETAYAGFERAETGGWTLNPAGADETTEVHSGENARKVVPGTGPQIILTPSDQTGTYVFSAWIKTPSGFGGGQARLKLHTCNTSNDAVYPASNFGSVQTVSIGDTQGEWVYVEVEIDLDAIHAAANIQGEVLRVKAVIENSDPSLHLWTDELRVHPSDAMMTTYSFNELEGLNAVSGPNGQQSGFYFDEFGRLLLMKNHQGEILQVMEYNFKNQ